MAEADPEISLENSRPADGAAMTGEPVRKRNRARLALMLSVPLALLVAGVFYWLSLQGKVTTDNAYVQQDKVSVSALVGGEITEVLVGEATA